MKEVKVTISLLVSDDYLQSDIDEIVHDFKEIIFMTDTEDIRYDGGEAEFVE